MKKYLLIVLILIISGLFLIKNGSGDESRDSISLFEDVTGEAGLDYLHYDHKDLPDIPNTYSEKMNYLNFFMAGDAAVGDYNKDGWEDLYVTRIGASGILFRNNGNGTFKDVTEESGLGSNINTSGVSWGDIDSDGDLDLYLTTVGARRYYLYINNGEGIFTEEAEERGVGLEGPKDHYGFGIDFGDYDNDGYLDFYTTEWRNQLMGGSISYARLFHNLGEKKPGFFEDVTKKAGLDYFEEAVDLDNKKLTNTFSFEPLFFDLDEDGHIDLIIAGDFGTSKLFWNNGDGTFTDGTKNASFGTEENAMGLDIADYDEDGRMDVFVTSIYDPDKTCVYSPLCLWGYTGNRLYKNEGGRVFSDQTDNAGVRDGGWGWDTSFFDYDLDGDQDLMMVNGVDFPLEKLSETMTDIEKRFNYEKKRLWRNDNGIFTDVTIESGITTQNQATGLEIFDYDNDGDLDIFIVNNGGKPILYRNNTL